jgi:hypothetical protein
MVCEVWPAERDLKVMFCDKKGADCWVICMVGRRHGLGSLLHARRMASSIDMTMHRLGYSLSS